MEIRFHLTENVIPTYRSYLHVKMQMKMLLGCGDIFFQLRPLISQTIEKSKRKE